jgi:hypothetical protein
MPFKLSPDASLSHISSASFVVYFDGLPFLAVFI